MLNLDKLGLNLKKLVLNQTRLILNSMGKHLNQATKPKKGASGRLMVKQKTIRVLLDSGLSGDLLFLKKDPPKTYPL